MEQAEKKWWFSPACLHGLSCGSSQQQRRRKETRCCNCSWNLDLGLIGLLGFVHLGLVGHTFGIKGNLFTDRYE